jgi:hypothetical protein
MPEPRAFLIAVRVKAAAADPQDRALLALRRQRRGSGLPSHRGRMVKGSIEGIGGDMKSGIRGTGIGGTQ